MEPRRCVMRTLRPDRPRVQNAAARQETRTSAGFAGILVEETVQDADTVRSRRCLPRVEPFARIDNQAAHLFFLMAKRHGHHW